MANNYNKTVVVNRLIKTDPVTHDKPESVKAMRGRMSEDSPVYKTLDQAQELMQKVKTLEEENQELRTQNAALESSKAWWKKHCRFELIIAKNHGEMRVGLRNGNKE